MWLLQSQRTLYFTSCFDTLSHQTSAIKMELFLKTISFYNSLEIALRNVHDVFPEILLSRKKNSKIWPQILKLYPPYWVLLATRYTNILAYGPQSTGLLIALPMKIAFALRPTGLLFSHVSHILRTIII